MAAADSFVAVADARGASKTSDKENFAMTRQTEWFEKLSDIRLPGQDCHFYVDADDRPISVGDGRFWGGYV